MLVQCFYNYSVSGCLEIIFYYIIFMECFCVMLILFIYSLSLVLKYCLLQILQFICQLVKYLCFLERKSEFFMFCYDILFDNLVQYFQNVFLIGRFEIEIILVMNEIF